MITALLMYELKLAIDMQMTLLLYLLVYEYFHTISHARCHIKNRWLSDIVNVHRWHHQENSSFFNMGITYIFFDKVLGTYRPFPETYVAQKEKNEKRQNKDT